VTRGWISSADLFSGAKDIYGVAEPATPGDSLDVTISVKKDQTTSQTSNAIKATIPGFMTAAAGESADGLSVGQKIFFVGGISAVCALFLRSRGASTAAIDKARSLA